MRIINSKVEIMVNPLPKWLFKRYCLLWVKLKDREFTHNQAVKILPDNKQMVSLILSEIRKAGWLEMRLDPKDARKRLYRLKSPEYMIKEIAKGVGK